MNRVSLHKREDLRSISLVTQILCFSVVTSLVALRLSAKVRLRHPFGVDDGTCFACLIHVISTNGKSIMLYGMGMELSLNLSMEI